MVGAVEVGDVAAHLLVEQTPVDPDSWAIFLPGKVAECSSPWLPQARQAPRGVASGSRRPTRPRRATWRGRVILRRVSARDAYPHGLEIPTRWKDNDVYGHVNNVEYLSYFDTVINSYLITEGGLDIHAGEVIGECAESHCEYNAAFTSPETVEARLRVGRLGRSSVRYEIGLFRGGEEPAAATGWFVHVFVERQSRQPAEIPGPLRSALERLVVSETPAA